jgi:hypothetical protein
MEDLSPAAIEKHVLNEAFQHPLTTLPAAVAILSGLYMLAFEASNLTFLLAFGAGLLSVGAWIFNYFIRGESIAQNYVRERLAQRRAMREHEIVNIKEGFQKLRSKEGEQAAEELHQAYQKTKKFLQERESKLSTMPAMRLQILAEETYFQGVDVLRTALEITRALQEINVEKLEREAHLWESQRQELRSAGDSATRELTALERRIELNRRRIQSYRNRQSALAELFAESEACEASLEDAYMQFAGVEAKTPLRQSHIDDATSRLERAVAAARRVETAIRNQQAQDEVYLSAGETEKAS